MKDIEPSSGIRNSQRDINLGASISYMARAREGYHELSNHEERRKADISKLAGAPYNKQRPLRELLSGNRPLSNGLSQNKNVQNVKTDNPNRPELWAHKGKSIQGEKDKQEKKDVPGLQFTKNEVLMPKIPRLNKNGEESAKQPQRYFGEAGKATANLTNMDRNARIITDLVNNLRNPTLGEILNRNPDQDISEPSSSFSPPRPPTNYKNECQSTSQMESITVESTEVNGKQNISKEKLIRNKNLKGMKTSESGGNQSNDSKRIPENLQGVPSQNTFVYYSKDNLNQGGRKRQKVLETAKKFENPKFCPEHQASTSYSDDQIKSVPSKVENGNIERFKSKAYPDHPERDSLDGNLPGSSHGTGNPPPPPAPPNTDTVTNNPNGGGAGFTKGPNAKNKKHKKLKNEPDTGGTAGNSDEKDKRKGMDSEANSKDNKTRDVESSGGYRPRTEPYTYLWVVMSGMYGKLIVLLMLAFCLTEVLDNRVEPLTFQGIFLMYLYVGSIVAIMCIYVTVIIDNCPSLTASKENLTKAGDPEAASITSFGTLKRAHISRSKTSRTSFYLRIGALVFGLGTLIFNGLEIAMHSTMKGECVEDIIFAHPIMQALFTFLQMHFLFVNSEVIVEKFGQIARFGFMHLVATNLAIWTRMVVWESASEWIEMTYTKGNTLDAPFHAKKVLQLYSCFNNNSLGKVWTNAQPYLFPFLVQYSLIAAAVTYIMWCNVGKERLQKLGQLTKKALESTSSLEKRIRRGRWKVDCRSASKGLFMGLLVLVGGIVILIIFFVMKDQEDFKERMFWICNGTQMTIFTLSIISTIIGFIQIPKLSISSTEPLALDKLLLSSTILGVYLYSIFGMIVGGLNYQTSQSMATFCTHALLLIQVSLQGMLVAEASRRTCATRFQMMTKPGRQVITFLLFSNITLWLLDTFMTHTNVAQEFQISFYGVLAWGVISRISLPLMILYRFHSAVILVEIWKNTYRTKTE